MRDVVFRSRGQELVCHLVTTVIPAAQRTGHMALVYRNAGNSAGTQIYTHNATHGFLYCVAAGTVTTWAYTVDGGANACFRIVR